MGLEYNLSEISESEKLNNLRVELAPRNQCIIYVQENGSRAELVEKEDFDEHCKNNDFLDGPYRDAFGDGYGEPYRPHRQAFGRLKNGKVIYCELSPANQEKVKKLLNNP